MSNPWWVDEESLTPLKPKKILDQHPLSRPHTAWQFLEQTKFWVNAAKERVRIKDMDQDYLFATMTWLLRRADDVKLALELYYATNGPEGEAASEQFDASFNEFIMLDSKQWMKATPLFKRLEGRYRKLNQVERQKMRIPLLDIRES